MNISIITHRNRHHPSDNAHMLAQSLTAGPFTNIPSIPVKFPSFSSFTLKSAWPALQVGFTERKDLTVDGFKISGSAYRLNDDMAYHHCTLLLNSDLLVRIWRHFKCTFVDIIGLILIIILIVNIIIDFIVIIIIPGIVRVPCFATRQPYRQQRHAQRSVRCQNTADIHPIETSQVPGDESITFCAGHLV